MISKGRWKKLWKKLKQQNFIPIFLYVFFFGHIFFFSSTYWMPEGEEVIKPTPFFLEKEVGAERTVILYSWKYSEAEKEMEVTLKVENNSFDQKNHYRYQAFEKNKGKLPVEVLLEEEELVVLRVEKVPKHWRAISLRIYHGKKEKHPFYKGYGTKENIKSVTSLPRKSRKAYFEGVLEEKKDFYIDAIESLEKGWKKEEVHIQKIEQEIEERKERLTYQTEEEQKETLSQIEKAKGETQQIRKQMEEEAFKVEEFKERIRLIDQQLEEGRKEE